MKRKKIFRFFDRYLGIPVIIFLSLFTRTKRRLPIESLQNILFIKLAAIGDTLLLIPTLRKLKNSFPKANITFLSSDINYEIAKKIPYIDKIINVRVYDFLKDPVSFIRFIKNLRKIKYELIIDAGQWERINALITIFAKKDYSIGFKTKGQWKHIVFDSVVEHLRNKHELENFMDLLIPLGITSVDDQFSFDDLQTEYYLRKEDIEFRDNFWKDNDLNNFNVICLHPCCGDFGKQREWPIRNFIELAHKIKEIDPGIKIIITGTKEELQSCKILFDAIEGFAINTAGKLTMDQAAAIVQNCMLIICGNTGMLHISASLGTPSIGLHGPTDPNKWRAYNKDAVVVKSDKYCSPCLYLGHEYGCGEPHCMGHISVNMVLTEVIKKLNYKLTLN